MKDDVDVIIEQWRKERPDLDPSPVGIIGRVSRAALRIERDLLEPVFRRFGLSGSDFDVLATLRRHGAPYSLSATELWSSLMLTSGTMTSRVDRLVGMGLVERRPDPKDRRSQLVALTNKGLAVIEEAAVAHYANEAAIVSGLSGAEQKQLAALLKRLLATLPAAEPAKRSTPRA